MRSNRNRDVFELTCAPVTFICANNIVPAHDLAVNLYRIV